MATATQTSSPPPTTVSSSPDPKTPFQRLLKWLKKILIWSLILYALNWSAKKLGWEKWEDFDQSARKITDVMLDKSVAISPMVLVKNLQSKQMVAVKDDSYQAPPSGSADNWFSRLQLFNTPTKYRELSFWEKIKIWAGSFWFNQDGSANWFGRVTLALALLLAVQFTWDTPLGKRITGSYISDLYLVNIFSALLTISFLSLLFYFLVHLFLWVAGAIVALFASVAAGGGFLKFVLDEVKSDVVDESKKISKL
ncbi:MAG: hypothetical protein DI535_11775 [Citrobacter freundii]|nr:MAG: hypothetical protein DI535_11775 [Citrobacter freundii]